MSRVTQEWQVYFSCFRRRDERGGMELSLIHISEPTRLGMISYAVFCLKKKKHIKGQEIDTIQLVELQKTGMKKENKKYKGNQIAINHDLKAQK